ncbi:aldehyde dehydrogenase family protein [Gluconacetobacter azotocaptans]|uniref:Aldehyde dehydrogenase family protein n=1 Tax=Gluconacetobacter azotocaptans TaxID=142834 RepID=A0A7W4PDZ4_9PROT|nr:aldehyde dehydrogenase family protein [Gluconacetobacter azotocaptans]MBB2190243.1 aldehyde dehydrogenase family protein [Gluconacetobacter azotocaptans]MBM9402453.1 aldehyde dehydrogenase family protein [Gluconacetobacter azotocaptans]GBQ35850.1 aldehyde dehydrogenase [Gluconacetobacter azotocaptans DSM 13594]
MAHALQMYIDGKWVDPTVPRTIDVINPATEAPCATIALGSAADVDLAVAAARRAFGTWSVSTRAERIDLLERILTVYRRRMDDMASAISQEMGAPLPFARDAQAWAGMAHLEQMIRALRDFTFDQQVDDMLITREPVGVVGLITPWNWPMNQIACKVGPALAAGCTMVLKPSEIAPLSGLVFTEILDEAGVPPGVYNLVNGDGPEVGEAIARHRDIEMVSFTGSTRAGTIVARLAADTVKRVHQELGGKSPNIILPDADLADAVRRGVAGCFGNSGQSCDAPTRMLVPRARMAEAMAIAAEAAAPFIVGPPDAPGTRLGPVVSDVQFAKIQALIQAGLDEGATLVAGGPGRPEGLPVGYYVRPTIFGNVTPAMTIAREEIFGPVLSIIAYDDEEDAIAIANDTPYGLAAYVQSGDLARARAVARRLRAGNVNINGAAWTVAAPFGGYKQSGNGRECGEYGLTDFLEIKAILGYGPEA